MLCFDFRTKRTRSWNRTSGCEWYVLCTFAVILKQFCKYLFLHLRYKEVTDTGVEVLGKARGVCESSIRQFLAHSKNELMQWRGVRRLSACLSVCLSVRPSVCKLLRKSLLYPGKWLDRDQTCTGWSPGEPTSRVCSRSRSKVTWYAHFLGFLEWSSYSVIDGLVFQSFTRESRLKKPGSNPVDDRGWVDKNWLSWWYVKSTDKLKIVTGTYTHTLLTLTQKPWLYTMIQDKRPFFCHYFMTHRRPISHHSVGSVIRP